MEAIVKKKDFDLDYIGSMVDMAISEILDKEEVSDILFAYSTLISSIYLYRSDGFGDPDGLQSFLIDVSNEINQSGKENVLEFVKFIYSLVSILSEDFDKVSIRIKNKKASVKLI